ncbi:unnamed protein product [Phaeothamnion confervicola]
MVEVQEIRRALIAVEDAKRRRVEANHNTRPVHAPGPGAAATSSAEADEQVRRRKDKKEQLAQKRREMEARLMSEASKLQQLADTAKRKIEGQLGQDEQLADDNAGFVLAPEGTAGAAAAIADEAIPNAVDPARVFRRATTTVGAAAAAMSLGGEAGRRRQLEEKRRAEEEKEMQRLLEEARSKANQKLAAEAKALAAVEKEAAELATRCEQMRRQLSLELQGKTASMGKLEEQAAELARRRAAAEAQARSEEAELQRAIEAARVRAQEKVDAETAAVAELERHAAKLAERRAQLLAQAEAATNEGGGDAQKLLESKKSLFDCLSPRDHRDRRRDQDSNLFPAAAAEAADTYADGDDSAATAASVGEGGEHHYAATAPGAYREPPPAAGLCEECAAHRGALPLEHFAAASGHVDCLRGLAASRPGLPAMIDAARRTPLFYACANGQAACATLLLAAPGGVAAAGTADANRDTALHAAASSGSASCVYLLLSRGGGANGSGGSSGGTNGGNSGETSGGVSVAACNAMGMTPAHLAKSREVLEVLLEHGADLNHGDAEQRTPLFIACASNRVEAAEFLCELLDSEDGDLGKPDRRGDTPMHAAACNGCTACLLLLLQYGTEPDARNRRGMRPIDLAARRGHSACEKVLLEYQLHHALDNSYFDSVLFLATLEGHRRCKEALRQRQGEEESGGRRGSGGAMEKVQSMWSLRQARSMRLQQWGDWIAYEEPNVRGVFWYNHVTQDTQWEMPPEVAQLQAVHAAAAASAGGGSSTDDAATLAKASMRLRRKGDWLEYTVKEGKTFYFNDKTNAFQWERPSGEPKAVAVADPGRDPGRSANSGGSGGGGSGTGGGGGADGTAAGGSNWVAYKDPASGLVFWYSHVTGESRWEPPDDDRPGDGGCIDGVSNGDIDVDADGGQVRSVDDVDELFTPR